VSWTLSGSLKGPAGAGAAYVHTQASPAATWTIPHGLARVPHGVLILVGGELVLTDTEVDATNVVLTFPAPTAGVAHIL